MIPTSHCIIIDVAAGTMIFALYGSATTLSGMPLSGMPVQINGWVLHACFMLLFMLQFGECLCVCVCVYGEEGGGGGGTILTNRR
jgi:hypothetical protein